MFSGVRVDSVPGMGFQLINIVRTIYKNNDVCVMYFILTKIISNLVLT